MCCPAFGSSLHLPVLPFSSLQNGFGLSRCLLALRCACQGARAGAALLTGTEGQARHQNTTLVLKSQMCVMGECSLRASYQSCVSLEAAEGGIK